MRIEPLEENVLGLAEYDAILVVNAPRGLALQDFSPLFSQTAKPFGKSPLALLRPRTGSWTSVDPEKVLKLCPEGDAEFLRRHGESEDQRRILAQHQKEILLSKDERIRRSEENKQKRKKRDHFKIIQRQKEFTKRYRQLRKQGFDTKTAMLQAKHGPNPELLQPELLQDNVHVGEQVAKMFGIDKLE